MARKNKRLTALNAEDLSRLQAVVDELSDLQEILNQLPLGLQVETLSDGALTQLREVAAKPEELLAGPNLLLWNNVCRHHTGLQRRA